MKLLIDAGNSRVKWVATEDGQWRAQGAVDHADIASLALVWSGFALEGAWLASVARPEVAARLAAAVPCPLQEVRSMRAFGDVRNHYRNIAEQGVDRWLAVLGARARCREDVIVASCGTALTVECLTAEGDYLGGLILPGLRLMLQSLAQGTAQLDREAGVACDFPQGTADALASGALAALTGAIESQRVKLSRHTGRAAAPVILTGGDAASLAPWLAGEVKIVDNLVLIGLSKVADAQ